MGGGIKTLLTTVALAAAGCATDTGEFNIRALADPLTKATRTGNPTVAEARGLLALGNVGLALEAFRKALREQPVNLEALAGVAECYERMGRYDLSRRYYESALAVGPRNAVLLNTFAASLQRQGRLAEAAAVRAEAAVADAAAAVAFAAPAQAEPVTVTQWKIEPQRALASEQVTVALPPPRKSEARGADAAPQVTARGVEPAVGAKPPAAVPNSRAAIAEHNHAPASVTVALPPAKLAENPLPMRMRQAPPPAAEAPAVVAPPMVGPTPAPAGNKLKTAATALSRPAVFSSRVTTRFQPRLERLSPGEVAIVTGDEPVWKTRVVAQSRQSVTVRFEAFKTSGAPPNIRLLNAARSQGLAARTRNLLIHRGWRKIEIGDARQVRMRSLVLYPPGKQLIGRRLAAQFGFRSALSKSGTEVVVLLGRDAPAARSRRRV